MSQAVKRVVRNKKIQAGGKQARNKHELVVFLEELTGPAEKVQVKTLAELFLKFFQGYYTDATMSKKLNGLFPVKDAPEALPTLDDTSVVPVAAPQTVQEAPAVAPVAQDGFVVYELPGEAPAADAEPVATPVRNEAA